MKSPSSRRLPRLVPETLSASQSIANAQRGPSSIEPSPYLPDEVIGDRYRLVRELGRGGMGVVWVAHSLVLGVDVALKMIRASAAGPAIASRMAREAHAAARLGHPALVRVFDFGWTSRGDPYLVMELVQGETLSALLARETRSPAIRAVQMLLPIADGLRMAHDKSIVHRDIKPENIFLATDALGRVQPKLLDFGIAKVGPTPGEGKLTQFGAVLGSPEYMSPEQALGVDDVDERSDVWSLSVVLYELITGSIPFRKPNYNALMHAIINEPAQPTPEHGAGDDALWLVLERGLAKSRDQRWANMTEFGEALALWLYEHGIKEDLSGNSIRAVWLDGALSGIRADLSQSSPPERGADSSRPTRDGPARRAGSADPFGGASSLARVGARQRNTVALALLLGALGGGVAVAVAIVSSTPKQDETSSMVQPPSVTPARPVASATSVASAVPEAMIATPTPSAAIKEAKPAQASSRAPAAARFAPRPSTASKAGVPKRSHDFGF
jgi:serine/threonine-protein kinase